MAGRKDKNIVDYFPHYVNHGKTIFILESKFKSDGYTAWFKILEILGKSENHFIDCRNIENMEFLKANIPLIKSNLEEILNLLYDLNAIHKELWENKIIWSGNFIKEIKDVYKRRNNSCMNFNDLCLHLSIKCKHEYNEYGINVNDNSQSKVKESKVKEFNFKKSLLDLGIEEQIVSDWLKVRAKKKASNTKTAFNRIKKEIDKSGFSANDCITKAVEKSWQGFEADWMKNKTLRTDKLA